MGETPQLRTLAELAAQVGGEVDGDGQTPVRGVNSLAEAGPGELAFFANATARYRAELASTRASAVVMAPEADAPTPAAKLRVQNPYLAFARISAAFAGKKRWSAGVSGQANVHPEATVHPEARVMGFVTVERGAQVGARSVLYPGVYVGEDASVGEDCILYPNAVVLERCRLGSRVTLHASAVIGSDGFGFAFNPQGPEHFKVPQVGIVRIEDDVEVGASSCVDRATLGETVVGRGSKLDNLVQVAHNVKVGPLAILCGQVGIAGSTELGAGVVMAGQSGVVNHVQLGAGVKVGARSAVLQSVEAGQTVSGFPAIAHTEWLKASTAFAGLGNLVKEVRRLRQRVEALEKETK